MAVEAALREDQPRPRVPAPDPPYVFVVRHDQSQTFSSLRDLAWTRPDLIGVCFDRRWIGERRNQPLLGYAERRRGERREAEPTPSWTTQGFVLARSTALSATVAAGPPPTIRASVPPVVRSAPQPSASEPVRASRSVHLRCRRLDHLRCRLDGWRQSCRSPHRPWRSAADRPTGGGHCAGEPGGVERRIGGGGLRRSRTSSEPATRDRALESGQRCAGVSASRHSRAGSTPGGAHAGEDGHAIRGASPQPGRETTARTGATSHDPGGGVDRPPGARGPLRRT